MPPWGLLAVSLATVAGTLAVAPLSPEMRPLEFAALASLGLYAAFGKEPPRFRAAILTALVLAALNARFQADRAADPQEQRTARYAATLLERQRDDDGSTSATFALDGGLVVAARLRGDAPQPGSRCIVRGRLEPFDEARNPGEPSERDIQSERGLDARLNAATILSVTGRVWNARAALASAHEWAHAQLRERLGEPAASVLAGELWGERSALPPALRAEFQETGTVHILVTAGLHMGAVAAIALLLFGALGWPRALTCTLAGAVVWSFVWWSGAQLPAERAATMATLAFAARACGRAALSWNALAIAAIAVCGIRPESVASASFALSFSCVGAIFACAGPIERWLEARVAVPPRVREAVTLTLATQLGTWPLGAAIFLQFAPYAALANLAVVPCVALTMALGALQLAFAWNAALAQVCANLDSWLLAWMLGAVQTSRGSPLPVCR